MMMYDERNLTMKVIRIACCLSVLLLALLAVAFSRSTTSHAQGLPCTPVAQGNGSQTCTMHFKDAVQTMHIGPPPACLIAGTITQTFNGVFHITINVAGDSWDTSTMAGPFTLVPDDPSIPTYTGHTTAWFGDSFNNQNFVMHFTINAHATAPNAPPFDFHENFHFSVSADTNPPVFFDNATC
jgi:hypothetical protein